MRRILSDTKKVDQNTLLLLHGESFIDSSYKNHVLTVNNATISSNSKFGKSIYMNGSGYQVYLDKTDFQLGSNDFTFDFWIKLISTGNNNIIVNMGTLNTWAYGYQITMGENGHEGLYFVWANKPSSVFIPVAYSALQSGFHHIAFVRKGTIMKAYLDGILASQSTIGTIPNAACSYFYIGSHTNGAGGANFYIDEFRFSNIARWTANFTPPAEPY